MTTELEYHVVDVFTDRPYAGNPLAVVLDADDLPSEAMQALAREFHLSETAFPVAATHDERARGVAYRLRIFTPEVELPFAGHPSVGTAWLLASLGRVPAGDLVQVCAAGDRSLHVSTDGGGARLTSDDLVAGELQDPEPALAAVGLGVADLAGGVRVCSAGLAFTVLPVRADALGRCQPNVTLLRSFAFPASDTAGVYVTAWAAGSSTARTRMFAGDIGVPEDPATGSAALALAPWLVAEGAATSGLDYEVVQGVELGRPSTMSCRVEVVDGRAARAHVGGGVARVAHGHVVVPS
jgi:trans-2,3-dihydro-3-hydroxyanthranilate isomerase